MTSSIIVLANTSDEAVAHIRSRCPELLCRAVVQRVFEVEHVVVDWPTGEVSLVRRD